MLSIATEIRHEDAEGGSEQEVDIHQKDNFPEDDHPLRILHPQHMQQHLHCPVGVHYRHGHHQDALDLPIRHEPQVVGRVQMDENWRDGPQPYLGVVVDRELQQLQVGEDVEAQLEMRQGSGVFGSVEGYQRQKTVAESALVQLFLLALVLALHRF